MVDPIQMFPRPLRQLLGPLGTSATGMSRQQEFMEVISNNIANANTTKGPDGKPYQREIAVAGIDPRTGAPTTTVVHDTSPDRLVLEPGNPDADANGYVHYPNVDLANEQVDLMIASRMHEANATAFEAGKAMLHKALDI
ncbi:MAG TPA: flagellar basal body rod protein FlgC [Gemmatimonadales bacterium]|jgi:flagellar basal-body rod protein FlgC|nr:flagellar basal body rod protein FlgC [Gemmatimonadales bacterium]